MNLADMPMPLVMRGVNRLVAEEIVKGEIEMWLMDQHFSTWGRGFGIKKEDERQQAVDWFYRQLASFATHVIEGSDE